MGNLCTYCNGPGPFTNEHAMSDWVTRVQKGKSLGLSKKIGKFLPGGPKIRDVCETCNSVPLARLDDYAYTLYEPYLSRVVRANETVSFKFDFHQLSRWLGDFAEGAFPTSWLLYKRLDGRSVPILIDWRRVDRLTYNSRKPPC